MIHQLITPANDRTARPALTCAGYAERAYFGGDHCQHCAARDDHLRRARIRREHARAARSRGYASLYGLGLERQLDPFTARFEGDVS